jgi:hypothetical protein
VVHIPALLPAVWQTWQTLSAPQLAYPCLLLEVVAVAGNLQSWA